MDIEVNEANLINMNEHEYFNKVKEQKKTIDGAEKRAPLDENKIKKVLSGFRDLWESKSKDELIDFILIEKEKELRGN
jgi:hypothetical protein